MHRFYVDNCAQSDTGIMITGNDVNHIRNVLRLSKGEEIMISDGSKREYLCRIREIRTDSVTVDIIDIFDNAAELPTKITLFQGMPKSDKLEFVIQKAVELGVYSIVPVMTKRTVVKLDKDRAAKKLERYNAISQSAAKQSGRGLIPEVKNFMDFKAAVDLASAMDMMIIPYEEAKGIQESRQIISEIRGKREIGIFIGPEGGFARKEIEYAVQKGANIITLGNRILRTETAGLAVLSVIMFEIEE